MRRLILVACVAAAAFAGAGAHAFSRGARSELLSAARVCVGDDWDPLKDVCTINRRRVPKTDDLVCSVVADVDRPARLTIAITYDGSLQRRESRLIRPGRRRSISTRLRFPNLRIRQHENDPWGLPRGSYACKFRLGPKRAVVRARSAGPSRAILAAHACRPLGGETPIDFCDPPTQGRAIACSAVFVHRVGRRLGVQIFRGRGEAATLLYEGSDVARVPIAAEWAYTSAAEGRFMTPGPYECRFLVDGRLAATTPFTIPD